MKSLLDHTEQLIFLVHRHKEYGDHWVLVNEECEEAQLEGLRNRLIDMGGSIVRVRARATVNLEEIIEAEVDEDE